MARGPIWVTFCNFRSVGQPTMLRAWQVQQLQVWAWVRRGRAQGHRRLGGQHSPRTCSSACARLSTGCRQCLLPRPRPSLLCTRSLPGAAAWPTSKRICRRTYTSAATRRCITLHITAPASLPTPNLHLPCTLTAANLQSLHHRGVYCACLFAASAWPCSLHSQHPRPLAPGSDLMYAGKRNSCE